MDRIRLLIVDDHRLFRRGLVSLFGSEPGFEVVGDVGSGLEALAALGATSVDVALVDLVMPQMPGVEVIARLLAVQPSLGIVVLTASEESRDLLGAIQAGARGYVLKNADAETLFATIRRVHDGGAAIDDLVAPKVIELLHTLSAPAQQGTGLTPREEEVAALLVDGVDNAAIASKLVISENTVKTHVSHIYEKLGVKSRTDLVAWASRNGHRINRVVPEKSPPTSS